MPGHDTEFEMPEVPFDLKRVQALLLEMAKAIAEILDGNGIPHSIGFGTLLGAVRHGGFIPWDDDFDFFLFDDSYDIAIEALRESLPESMFLEDAQSEPNYFHSWAHVKDLGTACDCELYPQDELYSHHGLSVDLYRAKVLPEREIAGWRLSESIAYIERRKQLGFIDAGDFEARRRSYQARAEDELVESDRNMVAFPFWAISKLPFESVFPLEKIGFEGTAFWAPNKPEVFLETMYGAWHELPAPDNRIPHYSNVLFVEDGTRG